MSRFREFALHAGILGPIFQNGQWLVLDSRKGVLTLLEPAQAYPARIVKQALLSELETAALAELLAAYPDYCPYEVLLSAKTGETREQAHTRVVEARERGVMETEITPGFNDLIARCREKVRPFGMGITAMHRQGYLLTPLKRCKTSAWMHEREGRKTP